MRALLAACLVAVGASAGAATESPNPLRLIPIDTDVTLRIEPRNLADAIQSVPALRQLLEFDAVREALASTNAQRFLSFVAYYEKKLGAPWPELLDQLAGGGIVVATRFTRDNSAPALMVVQSKDAALLQKAVGLVRGVIEQELARQDATQKPSTETHRGIEVTKVGEAFYAVANSALLISNKLEGIHRAIDLHLDGSASSLAHVSGPADAAKLMPPNPLISMWVNLKPAHESPEGKEIFKQPKSDLAQTLFFGGLIDVIGQSPFVALGVYRTPEGFTTSVRMPAGRDATPDGTALHLAPPNKPGSLPLLEPANVLYSNSFYLDLGAMWEQREKILAEGARKQLDRAEKQVGRFLAGRKLSELLTQSGPYHRIVVAAQTDSGYSKEPGIAIPAFAFTSTMRSPDFGQALNAILRTVAFLTGTQAKLKLVEETIDGVKLVGYRFPEDGSLPNDTQNLRFAFSPCFASVGDHFFAASTIELGREMIGLLKKPMAVSPSSLAEQSRIYAAGGATIAKLFEDRQITQVILDRAISPADAKKEVQMGIDWLRGLGVLKMETDYRPHEFRFDVRWELKK
jgi:hypothetical protein